MAAFAESGGANKKPCTKSAPAAEAMSNWACVSIPSSTTDFPAAWASATTAPTKLAPAGLRRDVGRRIPQPEIGIQLRNTSLGNDFSVPVFTEAICHHPVVAGDRLQPADS
jgi:hypothetical protein